MADLCFYSYLNELDHPTLITGKRNVRLTIRFGGFSVGWLSTIIAGLQLAVCHSSSVAKVSKLRGHSMGTFSAHISCIC